MAKMIINSTEVSLDLEKIKDFKVLKKNNSQIILTNNKGEKFSFYYTDDQILYHGKLYNFDKNLRNKKQRSQLENDLISPMPGKIIKLNVSKGEEVQTGQILLILEAMKMEHTIKSPGNGTVEDIFYKEGDLVDSDVELIKIKV